MNRPQDDNKFWHANKKDYHNESKFWNIFFVIMGLGMIAFGLKDYVLPAVLVFLGYLLVNYGLQRMNKPSLFNIIKSWIDELD